MSPTAFGEHLKREREMRGVSLEEIAAATRINTRFLEAIENERWDQLPGGVFNRGFIRSIARYLGMDEDSLVAEYDLGAKNNGHSPYPVALPVKQMPRNWRPVAAVCVVILLVAGGIFVYIHHRAKIAAGLTRGVSVISARVHWLHNKPPGASSSVPAQLAPAGPKSDASAAPANAAPLTLKLEAGKPANVKVVADGTVVFQGPVRVNDVKQFEARNKFEVSSSESSALLLELNGQTVPPIGTPGQPGSVILTRSDATSSSGDPH